MRETNLNKIMLTEKKIQEELSKEFVIIRKYKIAIPNVYLYS